MTDSIPDLAADLAAAGDRLAAAMKSNVVPLRKPRDPFQTIHTVSVAASLDMAAAVDALADTELLGARELLDQARKDLLQAVDMIDQRLLKRSEWGDDTELELDGYRLIRRLRASTKKWPSTKAMVGVLEDHGLSTDDIVGCLPASVQWRTTQMKALGVDPNPYVEYGPSKGWGLQVDRITPDPDNIPDGDDPGSTVVAGF